MAKHIDADQLIKVLRRLRDKGELLIGISEVMYTIDDMPAADVVEVVRCRDCRYKEEEQPGMVYCPNTVGGWVDENWFCAGGEEE